MEAGFIGDIIRNIFAALDNVIYGLMSSIYRFLMSIADVQIFSHETLKAFTTRIYALLAIFMAFKLLFSFINYAVNPDAMMNEKTGGKKLIINIIVSLVMLIAVPGIIFPLSRQIQYAILNEGVLQEIILGVDQGSYNQAKNTVKAGRSMSYSIFSTFLTPNVCNVNEVNFFKNDSPDACDGGECANKREGITNLRYQLNGNCAKKINDALKNTDINAETVVTTYERAKNQFSVKILLGGIDDTNLITLKYEEDGDKHYLFDYKILISTIVGALATWMLVTFCFQTAVRAIKLGFLELIAPIPILSYMDSKAKSKSFDGWLKACVSTYLDLFVRLAALYFAIFVISSISLSDLHYASQYKEFADSAKTVDSGLVKLFIIIGALMFAQQIPKLIQDVFGVKLDGSFSLNPLKGSTFASGALGFVGGAALGTVANASRIGQTAFQNHKLKDSLRDENGNVDTEKYHAMKQNNPRLAGVASIFSGFAGGAIRSASASYKGKSAMKGIEQGVRRQSNLTNASRQGTGVKQRALDKVTTTFGLKDIKTGTADMQKSKIRDLQQRRDNAQSMENALKNGLGKMQSERPEFGRIVDGETLEMKYNNYDSYLESRLNDVMTENEKQRYEQAKNIESEDTRKNIMERLLNDVKQRAITERQIEADELLEKQEFNKVQMLSSQIQELDKKGKDYDKEINAYEEVRKNISKNQ